MDTTAISRWFLMPFLAIICVNVTSTTSLCMLCIIYFSSTQFWWWIGCHMFSLQTYFRFVQPLFFCWTFMSLCPCFHAPQFPFLLLLFSFLITMFLSLLVASCLHLQSFFCVIIFNGGIFLVSLVLIFEDVVTWVISPLWWVIIFICLFFIDFSPIYIFSNFIIVLVFMRWRYIIVFILVLLYLSVIGIPGIHYKFDTPWSFLAASVAIICTICALQELNT